MRAGEVTRRDVMADVKKIWALLADVPDPEIPAVSLVEMGIVRDVTLMPNNRVVVSITPTFSGCPALHTMKDDIIQKLSEAGLNAVEVVTVYSPAWTSD